MMDDVGRVIFVVERDEGVDARVDVSVVAVLAFNREGVFCDLAFVVDIAGIDFNELVQLGVRKYEVFVEVEVGDCVLRSFEEVDGDEYAFSFFEVFEIGADDFCFKVADIAVVPDYIFEVGVEFFFFVFPIYYKSVYKCRVCDTEFKVKKQRELFLSALVSMGVR